MTAAQSQYGGRKVREGTVVSDKMQKTVLVAVEAHFRHRLYKKSVRRVRRLMAHDEREDAHLGDRVRIVESRPISRRKRWCVAEVLARAELPELAAEQIDLELLGEVKREEEAPDAAAIFATKAVVVAPEVEEEALIQARPGGEPVQEIEVEEASEEAGAGEATAEEETVAEEETQPEIVADIEEPEQSVVVEAEDQLEQVNPPTDAEGEPEKEQKA